MMLRHSRRAVAFVVAASLMMVSGCAPETEKPPSLDSTNTSVPDSTQVDATEVTREIGGNFYGVTVQSVKSDGSNLELKLSVRIVEAGPKRSELRNKWSGSPLVNVPKTLRLIDFENGEVLEIGESVVAESKYAVGNFDEPSKGQSELTAYFASPKSDRVSLLMPFLGLIEDLPVTKTDKAISPGDNVEALDKYTFGTNSFQQVSVPFESEATIAVEDETVLISVPADILFEFGSAELSGQAVAAIETVKASVMEYSAAGELRVIGHTDDQGSDAINRPLSLARANAVAEVLGGSLPDGKYTTKTEGVGSDQPVMDGTTEEARTANRRVEIELAYEPPSVRSEPTMIPPPAPSLVAQGNASSIEYREGNSVRVAKAERTHGFLVLSFLLTRTAAEDGLVDSPFKSPVPSNTPQYSDLTANLFGAGKVSLLTDRSTVLPLGYRLPPQEAKGDNEGRWRTLADRNLLYDLASNTSLTATVMWPDPGTETVTVDVENCWRITDIPIDDPEGK